VGVRRVGPGGLGVEGFGVEGLGVRRSGAGTRLGRDGRRVGVVRFGSRRGRRRRGPGVRSGGEGVGVGAGLVGSGAVAGVMAERGGCIRVEVDPSQLARASAVGHVTHA
jgi:hypothetical protein